MSVTFHLRRIGPRSLAALRNAPSITTGLCDTALDFDVEAYERQGLEAVPLLGREAARPSFERRLAMLLAARREAWSIVSAAGLTENDVGEARDLGRSWWGMAPMIATPAGRRLFEGGEAIGEDVGYGPAKLREAPTVATVARDLRAVTRESAMQAFRAFEAAESVERARRDDQVGPPCSDEEFEAWSWEPLERLRVFVDATAARGEGLLAWYD
jgi:hypothetical protein